LKKKIWAIFQRILELFTQKFVTKLYKIWGWDPRSGIRKNLFRVPAPGPGVKKAPDPGSGSATLGNTQLVTHRDLHKKEQWSPPPPSPYTGMYGVSYSERGRKSRFRGGTYKNSVADPRHCDAVRDPDTTSQMKAQNLEKKAQIGSFSIHFGLSSAY
jgi:hypothetical protein